MALGGEADSQRVMGLCGSVDRKDNSYSYLSMDHMLLEGQLHDSSDPIMDLI